MKGCGERIPSDGHTHCLHHAPCMTDFKLYEPRECLMCTLTISTLLAAHFADWLGAGSCSSLLPLDESDEAHSLHCEFASWADPDLPVLLGFDHPSWTSPHHPSELSSETGNSHHQFLPDFMLGLLPAIHCPMRLPVLQCLNLPPLPHTQSLPTRRRRSPVTSGAAVTRWKIP